MAMYSRELYPPGVWTDINRRKHWIKAMSFPYLWNAAGFVAGCLPWLEEEDRAFWAEKHGELLREVERRLCAPHLRPFSAVEIKLVDGRRPDGGLSR